MGASCDNRSKGDQGGPRCLEELRDTDGTAGLDLNGNYSFPHSLFTLLRRWCSTFVFSFECWARWMRSWSMSYDVFHDTVIPKKVRATAISITKVQNEK